jgi:RND superfamily putative drug exporter
VKSIGLAFAAGILIDAFLVRMTLIPALMAVLGRHAWWLPRWLDRIVPNVDIEGVTLETDAAQPTAQPVAEPVAVTA